MSRAGKGGLAVVLAAVLFWVGGVVRDRRQARPSDVPIAVADGPGGACPPTIAAHDAACPYGSPAGPVAGIDYAAPFEAGAGRCVWLGKLRLPTGRLAAVDPLVFLDAAEPLEPAVARGEYPVVLRIHQGDVALALLMIGDARPARWQPARTANSAAPYDYGVDAGTGCYLDAATAKLLRDREKSELDRRFALARRRESDPARWTAALEKIPTSPDLLTLLRDAGYGHWASLCVDHPSGGNLIAFHSGAGDGSYPVFVGTDAAGQIAAFVTDFKVIDSGAGRHPWLESLDPDPQATPAPGSPR